MDARRIAMLHSVLEWVLSLLFPRQEASVVAPSAQQPSLHLLSAKSAGDLSDDLPNALLWVKDAPLFIDKANLDRFYDAVVRPPFKEHAPQTIKVSQSLKEELEKKFAGKVGLSIPSWLSFIFSGNAEISGEAKKGTSQSAASETTITLEPIATPHRQLEQLTVFYLLQQPQQLLVGGREAPLEWQNKGLSNVVPRSLVFLDLSPGTKFIPMAAEFANGKFVTFYDKLSAASGERPPKYDHSRKEEYWRWFDKHFDAGQSTEEIEKASTANGRIEWIDFRVPMNTVVNTMHVHLETGGQYNSGTFAYKLVRRALGHGMRLVGTLKDGPDFNVLALYEK
jgi:hypothetical protein